jgi:FecR protein
MTNARMVAPRIVALALAAGFSASGQSVVSTHSGLVYFFAGTAFLGNEPLVQKFGRFPDIGEGGELRTTAGRAEVLLTPGVFLRLDENSSIRMLSTSFPDTRVELLGGSVILEVTEKVKDTAVKLTYKNWQIRVPQEGVCRIDTDPPRIRAYKGQVAVGTEGKTETVTVEEGDLLPLAEVLVPEPPATRGNDEFKNWAMNRSEAISADNTIAAGIVDDPSQADGSDLALGGGYSYFPLTADPTLGVGSPYGLSFWSPYQATLNSIYFPSYFYGLLYAGWPSGGRSWPSPYPRPHPSPYPRWPVSPVGTHPPRTVPPRIAMPSYRPAPAPSVHAAVPVGAHR